MVREMVFQLCRSDTSADRWEELGLAIGDAGGAADKMMPRISARVAFVKERYPE